MHWYTFANREDLWKTHYSLEKKHHDGSDTMPFGPANSAAHSSGYRGTLIPRYVTAVTELLQDPCIDPNGLEYIAANALRKIVPWRAAVAQAVHNGDPNEIPPSRPSSYLEDADPDYSWPTPYKPLPISDSPWPSSSSEEDSANNGDLLVLEEDPGNPQLLPGSSDDEKQEPGVMERSVTSSQLEDQGEHMDADNDDPLPPPFPETTQLHQNPSEDANQGTGGAEHLVAHNEFEDQGEHMDVDNDDPLGVGPNQETGGGEHLVAHNAFEDQTEHMDVDDALDDGGIPMSIDDSDDERQRMALDEELAGRLGV